MNYVLRTTLSNHCYPWLSASLETLEFWSTPPSCYTTSTQSNNSLIIPHTKLRAANAIIKWSHTSITIPFWGIAFSTPSIISKSVENKHGNVYTASIFDSLVCANIIPCLLSNDNSSEHERVKKREYLRFSQNNLQVRVHSNHQINSNHIANRQQWLK